MKNLEEFIGVESPFLSTGLRLIDDRWDGLSESRLILIESDDSVANTCLMSSIIVNTAGKAPIAAFLAKLKAVDLMNCAISNYANIDINNILFGVNSGMFSAIVEATRYFAESTQLKIDDSDQMSAKSIMDRLERSTDEIKPRLVVVDDILSLASEPVSQPERSIENTVNALKAYAKNNKCTVIAFLSKGQIADCFKSLPKHERFLDALDFASQVSDVHAQVSIKDGIFEIDTIKNRYGLSGIDQLKANLRKSRIEDF